VLIVKKVILN